MLINKITILASGRYHQKSVMVKDPDSQFKFVPIVKTIPEELDSPLSGLVD